MLAGSVGAGEKASSWLTSMSRIAAKALGCSQAGGEMFARRCRFSRRANHRGRGVGKGGLRDCVGPCGSQKSGLVFTNSQRTCLVLADDSLLATPVPQGVGGV